MLCELWLNETIVGKQNAEFLQRKHPILWDLIQETGQMLSPSFKVGGRVGPSLHDAHWALRWTLLRTGVRVQCA